MAAERYSSDVLQMFYGPIPRRENTNLPEPLNEVEPLLDGFELNQNNFGEWLRVWRMKTSEENPNNRDLYMFERENREKIINLVEREIQELKNVKVSFQMQVKFSIEREEEMEGMMHFFQNDEPQVFNWNNEKKIKEKFDKFIEITKGEVEHWNSEGSGWNVKIARYDPLGVGTYLPLPPKLAKKHAIINVKTKEEDNECLKWALRRKEPKQTKQLSGQRRDKLLIDFPTPVKQIDKLEAQN